MEIDIFDLSDIDWTVWLRKGKVNSTAANWNLYNILLSISESIVSINIK